MVSNRIPSYKLENKSIQNVCSCFLKKDLANLAWSESQIRFSKKVPILVNWPMVFLDTKSYQYVKFL